MSKSRKIVRYQLMPANEKDDLETYLFLFTDEQMKQEAQRIVSSLQPLYNKVFRVDEQGDVEMKVDDNVWEDTGTSFVDILRFAVDKNVARPADLLAMKMLLQNVQNLPSHVKKYVQ